VHSVALRCTNCIIMHGMENGKFVNVTPFTSFCYIQLRKQRQLKRPFTGGRKYRVGNSVLNTLTQWVCLKNKLHLRGNNRKLRNTGWRLPLWENILMPSSGMWCSVVWYVWSIVSQDIIPTSSGLTYRKTTQATAKCGDSGSEPVWHSVTALQVTTS
jgi:hypothetical protein